MRWLRGTPGPGEPSGPLIMKTWVCSARSCPTIPPRIPFILVLVTRTLSSIHPLSSESSLRTCRISGISLSPLLASRYLLVILYSYKKPWTTGEEFLQPARLFRQKDMLRDLRQRSLQALFINATHRDTDIIRLAFVLHRNRSSATRAMSSISQFRVACLGKG